MCKKLCATLHLGEKVVAEKEVEKASRKTSKSGKLANWLVVVVVYPTPSEEWGHGGRPWSPRNPATP